ncbi:HAMP domain-containing protein [Cohnella sp. CFH 77786]|uniref:cache domain-containing sensor histidine kinase n=1 Tax=Cohnella sp. CFH 77786 TaxID=2662265 RepID=UPI001C60B9A6|nr:sensor histidine kinase [Cohnella sp. CFH 77786]MBW5445726.1 HAMP domain-containing protein [Cohnella sp. CFH 77786]
MRKPRGWLGFVNDIPLTWKFALIYLLCVLLPILTINVLFFQQVSSNIQTREENSMRMTLDRASKKAMDIILGGVTLSHSVANDRSLYEALDRDYPDLVDFYESFNNVLRDKMKPFMTAYPYVENISVYTGNGSIVSGGNYFMLDDAAKASPWYKAAEASGSGVHVLVYPGVDPINTSNPKTYFSILRKLNEYPSYGRYAKYLKIDIKVSSMDEILSQEKPYMELQVLGPEGRLLFPSTSPFALKTAPSQLEDGHSGLTFESRLGTASYIQGWKIAGTADESIYQEAIQNSERWIWTLAIISTLVPTSLIFIILRSYNYRIKRLSRHMDKAKNEKFDLIQLPEGKDEIGGLIRSFNRMTVTIEALINDVYKLEIQQKDMQLEQIRAELKLLQSQMNPHFLFNTLNALLVVCAKNGYTEATDLVKNLSLLLRRMLSWSDDAVALADELHFTEMYLKIEKFRFADRFDYTFEIDEGAAACMVPKMCIQPLVENACKHGLQSVKGQRHIRIEAKKAEAYLFILVADNGKGIDAQRLDEIRGQMNGRLDSDENIGLRNVYKRLRLHYGDRVDLYIDSKADEGTRISFRIPAMPTEQGRADHVLGAARG